MTFNFFLFNCFLAVGDAGGYAHGYSHASSSYGSEMSVQTEEEDK